MILLNKKDKQNVMNAKFLLFCTERAMTCDERLSDTISKWDRLARSGAVKDLKLVFKVNSSFICAYVCVMICRRKCVCEIFSIKAVALSHYDATLIPGC